MVIVSDFNDDDCDVDFGTITRLGDFDCDLVGDFDCDLVGDLGACLLDLSGDDDDDDDFDDDDDACRHTVEAPLDGTVLDGDFDA